MLAYFEDVEDPPEYRPGEYTIDTWRDALIAFFNEYWKKIETQITCPARHMKDPVNPQPKPCYGCIDMQVITCVRGLNHGNLVQVTKYKVRR